MLRRLAIKYMPKLVRISNHLLKPHTRPRELEEFVASVAMDTSWAMVQRTVQLYLRFEITRPDTGTGNWWVALDAKAADSVESKSRTPTRYDST